MKRNPLLVITAPLVVLTLFIILAGQPALAQQQGMESLKGAFGDDMVLEAAPDGSLYMETGKDGKPSQMIVTKDVTIESKQMNLRCDKFTYNLAMNRLVAIGRPVKIKKEDVRAICNNFEYYPKDGKAVLTGDPHVWQKTEKGESEVRGPIIKMTQLPDGRQSITVEAGNKPSGRLQLITRNAKPGDKTQQNVEPAEFQMGNTSSATKTKKPPKPAGNPEKVDSSKVDKIPETNIEGE